MSNWWNISFEPGEPWWEMPVSNDPYVEHDWIQGDSRNFQIQWTHIYNYIPIAEDREIVGVTVQPVTKSHPEGGYYDDLRLTRSLGDLKLYGAFFTHMPLEQLDPGSLTFPFEIPIFGAVATHDIEIVSVHLVPQQSVSGHASDYMRLIARNKETGEDICTKTYIAGNDLVAYEVDNFGPSHPDRRYITAGHSMSIVVEKVGAGFVFPRSVIVIQWDPA